MPDCIGHQNVASKTMHGVRNVVIQITNITIRALNFPECYTKNDNV